MNPKSFLPSLSHRVQGGYRVRGVACERDQGGRSCLVSDPSAPSVSFTPAIELCEVGKRVARSCRAQCLELALLPDQFKINRGKGILIGDIISRVDGAEVGHEPFSVVSSLIRGAKGSVVTIGFLRPKGGVDLNPTTIADPSATLPFEVKIRRDEPGAPANGTDGDDQGEEDDDDDSAVLGGGRQGRLVTCRQETIFLTKFVYCGR
jgi:hypothetical protein